MITTTHSTTPSLIGRAGDDAMSVTAHAPVCAANRTRAHAFPATVTAPTMYAATNAWLGGSGFGSGLGSGSISDCTVSTKRIHPGRLEGMT